MVLGKEKMRKPPFSKWSSWLKVSDLASWDMKIFKEQKQELVEIALEYESNNYFSLCLCLSLLSDCRKEVVVCSWFYYHFAIVNNICKILTFFTRYRETIQEQSGSDDDECQEEERKPIEVDSDDNEDSDWGYTWVLNVEKEKVVSRTDQYAALLWEFIFFSLLFERISVSNRF